MPERVVVGQPVSVTVKSGALDSGATHRVSLRDEARLRNINPADSVTVVSPRATTAAGLIVRVNGDDGRTVPVAPAGAQVTIFGPIYEVSVTVDAAVGGSGQDDVTLIFTGVPRVA